MRWHMMRRPSALCWQRSVSTFPAMLPSRSTGILSAKPCSRSEQYDLIVFISYFHRVLSGSILYSYLWPKWICHIDITQLSDDHNPGTFNAMKLAGPRWVFCVWFAMCARGSSLYGLPPRRSPGSIRCLPLCWPLLCLGMRIPRFSMGAAARPLPSALAVCWGYGRFVTYSCYWQDSILFFSLVVVIHPHRLRTVWVYRLFAFFLLVLRPLRCPFAGQSAHCGGSNFEKSLCPRA